MRSITDKQIDALFERGVVKEVVPSKEALRKHLRAGKPFHIYLGIDPTNDKLHLGHVEQILFLEDLRKLGAKVTLLFGTFTGLIGDPTGKESTRKQITGKDVAKNIISWKKQIAPILDISFFSNAKIRKNSEWFDTLSAEDLLCLLREVTVQHLLERDMFEKRMKKGEPLYAHELMYPILQGYDSVALGVDAELCGSDQLFNTLVGRTFAKRFLDKEKFVIVLNLIEADGVLMSKSTGTGVFVDIHEQGEHHMFGSIMALSDGFIVPLYRGCTRVPLAVIDRAEKASGSALRDVKLDLAQEIVRMFHGGVKALAARERYITQFSEKKTPTDAPIITVADDDMVIDILASHTNLSKSNLKRKFREGAVQVGGEKITDATLSVKKLTLKGKVSVRVGRETFFITHK